MAGSYDENPPPPQTPTQQAPHTLSTIKLPILKKEGLHKGYDRFQSILSQLRIHGAGVSTEDANQKFLRIFESDVKGSTGSSSSVQNIAFVSFESTNSTNDVSTTYGVSTSFGYNSQRENSLSYTDELMYSFFANQSSGPQLDHEDLEQLDEFDLEEMGLKWQVAIISMRLKKFYKKTRRRLQFDSKEPIAFDKTKVECFNCYKTRYFARECRSKGNQESRRRDARNTRYKAKDNGRRPEKQEEPKDLVTLVGEGVDWTGHVEYKQDNFALMAYNYSDSDTKREQLDDASIEIKAYTLALAKVEAQLVCNQKNQLAYEEKIRYGDQVHEGVLNYENEVIHGVFDSKSSDVEDSPVHDRFANVKGMHAVPPPMTGNYMPPGPDRESNSNVETLESVPKPVVVEPKVVSQLEVWFDAPIIEEYESNSDDEYVIQPSKEQEKPSFAFVNTVKHVKNPKEIVKEQNTYSPNPKADKRDWNCLMSKRMAKQVELNKKKGKGTGQWENRPMWNNVQRLNHQNKFVPTAVLTRTGRINTARHNFYSQAVSTSSARKVNVVRSIMNDVRPKTVFHKTHTPIRRPFNRTTAPRTFFSNKKVNTSRDKAVSAVGGIRETADNPQRALKNKGIIDSGCSKHMTGNKAYLAEYQDYNGGPVAFGGSKGYITGKGKIKIEKLDFEDVCFVKELQHFNLFSVSQIRDKKNK
ncbi:hypothetical protein Tco_0763034, partial [Tanacetum coccineum]